MNTPSEIVARKNDESHHQQAYFCWANVAARWGLRIACDWARGGELITKPDEIQFEGLLWAHHIPNGGLRNKAVALKLRREGTTPGIWDVFVPAPVSPYHGLYIEFKDPKRKPKTNRGKGGLSDKQVEFGDYASKSMYYCGVAYTWMEAVQITLDYFNFEY